MVAFPSPWIDPEQLRLDFVVDVDKLQQPLDWRMVAIF